MANRHVRLTLHDDVNTLPKESIGREHTGVLVVLEHVDEEVMILHAVTYPQASDRNIRDIADILDQAANAMRHIGNNTAQRDS